MVFRLGRINRQSVAHLSQKVAKEALLSQWTQVNGVTPTIANHQPLSSLKRELAPSVVQCSRRNRSSTRPAVVLSARCNSASEQNPARKKPVLSTHCLKDILQCVSLPVVQLDNLKSCEFSTFLVWNELYKYKNTRRKCCACVNICLQHVLRTTYVYTSVCTAQLGKPSHWWNGCAIGQTEYSFNLEESKFSQSRCS
jgi:hypothetical protein